MFRNMSSVAKKIINLNETVKSQKLNKTQVELMRLVEKQNFERVERLKNIRKKNLLTASLIGAAVICIYFYSMLSVKQENFLDDFNEPLKVEASD